MTIRNLVLAAALALASLPLYAQQRAGTGGLIAQPLLELKAGEIEGRAIYNVQGVELGEVERIARNKDDNRLNAIVPVEGFLGLGGSRVAIPLEQIRFQENRLVVVTDLGRRELRAQGTPYEERRFEAIGKEMLISEAAGLPERGPRYASAPGAGFQRLDSDGNGFVSREEAEGHGPLLGRWESLDTNDDGRLDRAEFAAFGEAGGMVRPPQGNGRGGMRDPTVRQGDRLRRRDQYRGNGTGGP